MLRKGKKNIIHSVSVIQKYCLGKHVNFLSFKTNLWGMLELLHFYRWEHWGLDKETVYGVRECSHFILLHVSYWIVKGRILFSACRSHLLLRKTIVNLELQSGCLLNPSQPTLLHITFFIFHPWSHTDNMKLSVTLITFIKGLEKFISTRETHLSICLFERPFSQFKRLHCEQQFVFLQQYRESRAVVLYFGEFVSSHPCIDFNTAGRK